jgi:hypothetical protein
MFTRILVPFTHLVPPLMQPWMQVTLFAVAVMSPALQFFLGLNRPHAPVLPVPVAICMGDGQR